MKEKISIIYKFRILINIIVLIILNTQIVYSNKDSSITKKTLDYKEKPFPKDQTIQLKNRNKTIKTIAKDYKVKRNTFQYKMILSHSIRKEFKYSKHNILLNVNKKRINKFLYLLSNKTATTFQKQTYNTPNNYIRFKKRTSNTDQQAVEFISAKKKIDLSSFKVLNTKIMKGELDDDIGSDPNDPNPLSTPLNIDIYILIALLSIYLIIKRKKVEIDIF